MNVFYQKADIKRFIKAKKDLNKSVGFVPTMGALHAGHLGLVKKALSENDFVIVSIFVNPTQFDNQEDLVKYPRTLEADVEKLHNLDRNIAVFAPTPEDIYGSNVTSETFDFDGLEFEMEGKFRTGHFDGVGTIVKKLFEAVTPDNAYFGEKDFQQLLIVKKLASKYHLPVNVVGCPIEREAHGLAMSSRNERLPASTRTEASFIYETLQKARMQFGTKSAMKVKEWVYKQFKSHSTFSLEYFEIADASTLKPVKRKYKNKKYRAFIAVYANDIRLIDNIPLN